MLHFSRWKIASILSACVLFMLLATPTFLTPAQRDVLPSWFFSKTLSLGLDLRGGSHLLLELDLDTYTREQTEALENDIRSAFREQRIGYLGLSTQKGKVTFAIRPETLPEDTDITEVLNDIHDGLEIEETEKNRYRIGFNEEFIQKAELKLIEQSITIVNRRVNETGTKEPIIQRQGRNRILLQVPGLEDPEELKKILGPTAKLTFHMVDDSVSYEDIQKSLVPTGTRIFPADSSDEKMPDGRPFRYALKTRVILSGEELVDANPTYHQGRPAVGFQFNAKGAKIFGDVTSQNHGKLFAITLDDKVITAPRIDSPILGGSGVIYGNFTVESANRLALLLRAGALPAPLKIVEERSVGPSLGADSVEAGKMACLVGVALVVVFMLMTYGLFGVFATVALVMNLVMILAALALFQASLTLPGIAGIVLTLGMAVDANVLIFERIREERKVGKSVIAATESGFKMAFGTIVDANLTTLIAALLLYYFGTSTVKGFAVTLSIGIISSMFSAIMLTRLMIVIWLQRGRPKEIPI